MDSRLDYDRFLQDKKEKLTAQTDKIIDAHNKLADEGVLPGQPIANDRISSMPLDRPLEHPLNTGANLENKTLGEKIMDTASNVLETTKETFVDATTWVKEHTITNTKAEPIIESAKETVVDIKEGAESAFKQAKGWVKENILPDSQKTAGEKLEENLEVAKETLAEGWTELKKGLGEAAGMVKQAIQPENKKKLKSKAKKLGSDLKEGAEELLDEAGNKLDKGVKQGRRRARRGGRRMRNKGQNLGDKAQEWIEDAGEAIQGAMKNNAPRRRNDRFNRKRWNERSRGGYMTWVPKAEQTSIEGQKLLEQAKDTASKGWEATKEKAGEALDWADKKLTPESQKTFGDKAEEFGDKVKDKADNLAFKVNEKITPESQKTVGDKLEEKAFHAKEAVKEKME